MPTDQGQCTCWLAPSKNGGTNPSAWLSMHHQVEMHSTDGQSMRGWPNGVHSPGGSTMADWIIELDDGNCWFLPLDEVAAIDPISPLSDADMIGQLVHGIANPGDVPDEGLDFDFLVGPHESIEISLKLRRHPCEAPG
jgi:hypothetical protein